MAYFPLFMNLKGKTCVVVGGGEVASRKVEILLKFEANLTIIAPEISNPIEELGNQGKVSILKKEYSEQDVDEAFLVVAATSSSEVNERINQDARKRNIPVNVVDDPQKCTFIFPSLIKRGDLTIGISTSGNYPALSKKIRKILEEVICDEYSEILSLLEKFRLGVRESGLDQSLKEKILRQVIDEFYSEGEISCTALKSVLKKYEEEITD